ncbi:branched-chain amino acid aminotransferase [Dermabacter sp.]|uniref:branched-chain amino acid aminotransferase n=1 Tax=Dermabacter sp. TaxID=37640 RepID=UPI0029082D4F|nr:branched-chain amino acid aminotransferase [Dermabacter sp.]MDU4922725.1 branched-chain amino acid aminotransferase [Dermabacter sp.]
MGEYRASSAPRRISNEERERILKDPGFGDNFTDYMAHQRWTEAEGWSEGEILPYGPLSLQPAAAVFHYAQEIFEGLKAFRHADESVWTFRPEKNAARIQNSARRLALPEISTEDFLASLRGVVSADEPWVPTGGESSLYLRPFMFASESFLGVRAAHTVDYYVIASPAGNYFSRGVQPLVVWVSPLAARAGRGGTGFAKCGGNYASSLQGKYEAAKAGADEVMFLDSETHSNIDELSGMNTFVVYADGRIVTPTLTGSILPGVTRESILTLAADRGLSPSEESVNYEALTADIAAGRVTEMFACGTAAVINPIGELRDEKATWTIGNGGSGEVTMALREELTGIQYGRVEDRHGWLARLV